MLLIKNINWCDIYDNLYSEFIWLHKIYVNLCQTIINHQVFLKSKHIYREYYISIIKSIINSKHQQIIQNIIIFY